MALTNSNPAENGGALKTVLGGTHSASTPANKQFQALDIETRVFASLTRVLISAPIENRLAVFGLICREAAACADIRRRQIYADCLWLADETGLTELVGTVTVTDTLMTAFAARAE